MTGETSETHERPGAGRRRFHFWLNVAALLLVTAAALYAMQAADYDFAGDDAFISFVYASNLAAGDGLVFNPGERVWGYTSPLQALVLGGFAFAGFDLVRLAPRLSLVWVCLTSIVVFQLLRRFLPDSLSLLASLYLALAQNSVSALETKLLVLLQCSFLLLLVTERGRSAALVGALACLTRPDSVLLVAPALLMARSTRTLSCLALFAVPGLLWLAFTVSYYGDIFPNSLHAKQGLTSFSNYLQHHFLSFTDLRFPKELSFLTGWFWTLFGDPRWAAAGLFLSLHGAVLLDPRLRSSGPLLHALLVYPWLLLLGYSAIGSIKSHDWEVYSGLFFCQLAALVGLFTLARLAGERWPVARGGILVLAATLCLASAFFRFQWFLGSFEGAREHPRMGVRHETYQRVSDWIRVNVPANASLSVLEVGTIGFYTKVHMIDVAGIVTRGFPPEERLDHLAFARRFEPDYMLVEGDVPGMRASRKLLYRRVQHFPSEGFNAFSLLRRD